MTPEEFKDKWRNTPLTERQSYQSHFNDLCKLLDVPAPYEVDTEGANYCFEKGAEKTTGRQGWADVWKRGCFGWEYKKKHADLTAAYAQLQQYAPALENPPLLIVCDTQRLRFDKEHVSVRVKETCESAWNIDPVLGVIGVEY